RDLFLLLTISHRSRPQPHVVRHRRGKLHTLRVLCSSETSWPNLSCLIIPCCPAVANQAHETFATSFEPQQVTSKHITYYPPLPSILYATDKAPRHHQHISRTIFQSNTNPYNSTERVSFSLHAGLQHPHSDKPTKLRIPQNFFPKRLFIMHLCMPPCMQTPDLREHNMTNSNAGRSALTTSLSPKHEGNMRSDTIPIRLPIQHKIDPVLRCIYLQSTSHFVSEQRCACDINCCARAPA
ncbi:unnamed protein product, partial [Ectocarpus sp. 6 AP-2014]